MDDCDGKETCCADGQGNMCLAASINECDACCPCMGGDWDAASLLDKGHSGRLAQLEKQVDELKTSTMKLNRTNGVLRSAPKANLPLLKYS